MSESELRHAWNRNAEAWIEWAGTPRHDHFFWEFNLPTFLEIVPKAGTLTVDIGCGEGRVGRALADLGHRVIGVDGSESLARAAFRASKPMPAIAADAAELPLRDDVADLAIAFMSPHDIDDVPNAFRETNRVLREGSIFCLAFIHPFLSAGTAYLKERKYEDVEELDGLTMTFNSAHRPLSYYIEALGGAGFCVDTLREPIPTDNYLRDHPGDTWMESLPLYVHLRCQKMQRSVLPLKTVP
jgi:SAM-dependent methyltransferase